MTVHSKLADVLRRHGAFCGSALPAPVTSDGNVLRVQVGTCELMRRAPVIKWHNTNIKVKFYRIRLHVLLFLIVNKTVKSIFFYLTYMD